MSPAEAPVLRAEALTVRYGSTTVVRDVDLTVHHGDGVAVLGRNGAGKSRRRCISPNATTSVTLSVAQTSGGSHTARWDLPCTARPRRGGPQASPSTH